MHNSYEEKSRKRWSKEEIGSILKEYRTAIGKTQLELGQLMNKSQQAVAHWEKGNSYPQLDDFFSLCELYQININSVFMGQDAVEAPVHDGEAELTMYYQRASDDDKELIRHILKKYKKKYLEEFSKELAI